MSIYVSDLKPAKQNKNKKTRIWPLSQEVSQDASVPHWSCPGGMCSSAPIPSSCYCALRKQQGMAQVIESLPPTQKTRTGPSASALLNAIG